MPDRILPDINLVYSFTDSAGNLFDLEYMKQFSLIILGHPIPNKNLQDRLFIPEEIVNIKKYVKEGGSLLVISGSRGDYDFPFELGSLRSLYQLTGVVKYKYGILMNSNPTHFNTKKYNIQYTTNDYQSHIGKKLLEDPIILSKATYCQIYSEKPPKTILTTPPDTLFHSYEKETNQKIVSKPVVVANVYGEGRVITTGCSQLFTDDPECGMYIAGNREFVQILFSWLLKVKAKRN
jgi:hypothetical protein